ncbi:hypothetical protein K439DRAFT_677788 [Ramaria rubella]|nr:hypothetical protein K439DRAFT_677788 [Ramaria rubella]
MQSPSAQSLTPTLPHDLFHSHIVPDILSEHLHQLLLSDEAPTWHAFHTMPQVSVAFRATCRSLCITIFGLDNQEDFDAIGDSLALVQSLWTRANPSLNVTAPLVEFNYTELMSRPSLIRIYICIALARSFLHADVLWHIMPEDTLVWSRSAGSIETATSNFLANFSDNLSAQHSRPSKMQDDKMHRVYMPLTCAMQLCDSIKPERLAHRVAEYIADNTPMYSTVAVMLKCTQDLESYIVRRHRVDMDTWIRWTLQTLGLIEQAEDLLAQMQNLGGLVSSFTRPPAVPHELTRITKVLQEVTEAGWGPETAQIHNRAKALLRKWTPGRIE